MAEVLGANKRGRKKEQLRIVAAELAAKVTRAKGVKSVKVDTTVDGKADTTTIEVPKGAQVVPFDLTYGKSPETVRMTLRNGAADADLAVTVASHRIMLPNGTESAIYHITAKGA
jgi:hypothetical protein